MFKYTATILSSALLLSACASEGDLEALNTGRTDVVQIQEKFRESILEGYVDNATQEVVIAESISPTDSNYQKAELRKELWQATTTGS